MLPVEEDLPGAKETLSAATAQACLPYWLETAGWLAALLSDAAAAAMGRMPATPRPETLYSKMHGAVGGWALAVKACPSSAVCRACRSRAIEGRTQGLRRSA